MIPYGLFPQISLIIVAVAIVITFIRPTLASIEQTQNKISVYQEEIRKVSDVNTKLASLVDALNNVPLADQTRVSTFIPDRIDPILVSRDLQTMATEAGVVLRDVAYAGQTTREVTQEFFASDPSVPAAAPTFNLTDPDQHVFTVSFDGTYSQLKQLLTFFDEIHYPLDVLEMQVTSNEASILTVEIDVATYTLPTPPPPAPVVTI